MDADGDGVTDDADACPDTVAGEIVDENGCSCAQHDGDNDGVDDCNDTCPHTASEDAVDESGCAESDIDDDNDGVSNGTDACPDTLVGEAVDDVGCDCSQRDGDADGVVDCDDDCPNSESAAAVDDTGCADADLDDDDGDGVINGSDTCASTPSGETVDATGCSCSQKDAGADGVNDCIDTCASTNAGLSVNTSGCATNQLDDDNDGVTNDADDCPNTATGATVDAKGCIVVVCTTTIVTIEPLANQDSTFGITVNNLGQVAGWYGKENPPFLWDSGAMTDLGTLGGTWGIPRDITESGEVSMLSKIARGQNHAAIWSGGTISDMQFSTQCSGCNGDMLDTNESGVSGGWSEWTSPIHSLQATLWYPDGTHAFVTPDGYRNALVQAVGETGDILIAASTGDPYKLGSESVGFLLAADGTLTDLGKLGTHPYLRPRAMSGSRIVGRANGSGADNGFLWQGGVLTDLDTFIPTDINAAGDVVGSVDGVAHVRRDGVLTDLNSLLPSGSGWVLTNANGINDSGRVVGSGTIGGVTRGFVMDLCE